MRIENKVENTWHCLLVQKAGSKEEEEKKESQMREREKLEIKQAVGLSSLLKKIVESVSVYVSTCTKKLLLLWNFCISNIFYFNIFFLIFEADKIIAPFCVQYFFMINNVNNYILILGKDIGGSQYAFGYMSYCSPIFYAFAKRLSGI